MKNVPALSTILIATLFAVSATAFAEEAKPIPRIVVTAKRMSDAEKAREAALETQAGIVAKPAAPKADVRNGKVG